MDNGEQEPQKTAAPEKSGPPEEITCDACGATNTEDDEVCRSCGEALWEDSDDDAEGSPEGWKPLIIGGALAAAVLVLFLWKPWQKPGEGGEAGAAAATGPTNEVHDLRQEGDLIWIGTSGGAFAYDRKSMEKRNEKVEGLLHPFIDSLLVDHKGTKWLGCFGGGLNYYDGNEWGAHPPTVTKGATIINAYEDKSHLLWFLSDAAGIFTFDRSEWKQITKENGLPGDSVQAFAQDNDGSIWIGTKDGAAHFKDGKWKVYRGADGLGNENVQMILVDKSGTKWFGTWGGGLVRFDGTNWTVYKPGPDSVNSDYVLSGAIDPQGNIWFGTYDGVTMWDGTKFTQYHESDGVLGTDVWATAADTDGYKWFGTYKGVTRLSPDNKEWKTIVH
jgi:ligand-binding sensor domain-containing protein